MAEDPHSLKNKLRSSLCLSCCFPQHHSKPRIVHSSSLHHHHKSSRSFSDLPHLKEKCCNFISRIGRHHHHQRPHSADFHYDPLSYSLNFEDDAMDDRSVDNLRNFSARLPPSPRKTTTSSTSATTAATTMEIAALS